MIGLSKWKLVLYLAAIFAAGSVSGWVVATKSAKQKAFTAPQPREITKSWRDRLHAKLNLSAEQAKQIDTIIERTSAEMQTIHGENIRRIWQGINNRNSQIAAILTPAQQKQFEQMEKDRQEMSRGWDAWRGKAGRGHERGEGSRDKRGTNGPPGKRPPGPAPNPPPN
jgi:Spy/CpxP family protein refolding chaperone